MIVLPNVVYIGPDKAGSTWLFRLLLCHSDVFVTPAKDLYFFDRYYHKGIEWYAQQFAGGAGYKVVAEISHDYLYDRAAAERLRAVLPNAKLMVCLREPSERAFSAYLYLIRSGIFTGTFEEAMEAHPGIVERGLYGKYISMYLEYFPRDQICCTLFDDLKHDAQRFSDGVFRSLGLTPICLPTELKESVLPAGRSRSVLLTKAARRTADLLRSAGMPKLVGRVKGSPLVQRLMYAEYRQEGKPMPSAETVARLRDLFFPDVAALDRVLSTSCGQMWAYYGKTASSSECPGTSLCRQNS